jgi:hypothetical protein
MTMIILALSVAFLLLCGGVMLGWSWAQQGVEGRSRRQAEFQRSLNAERDALRRARDAEYLGRHLDRRTNW